MPQLSNQNMHKGETSVKSKNSPSISNDDILLSNIDKFDSSKGFASKVDRPPLPPGLHTNKQTGNSKTIFKSQTDLYI